MRWPGKGERSSPPACGLIIIIMNNITYVGNISITCIISSIIIRSIRIRVRIRIIIIISSSCGSSNSSSSSSSSSSVIYTGPLGCPQDLARVSSMSESTLACLGIYYVLC